MSSINPWVIPTRTLNSTTKQATGTTKFGYAIGYNGAVASVKGQVVRGIAQHEEVAAGQDFTVATAGEAVGFSGEALPTIGTALTTAADGRIIAAVAGDYILGRSDQVASAANRYFRIVLTFEGTMPA